MKRFIVMAAVALFVGVSAQAEKKSSSFKVNGKCENCKASIEKAARSVKGVKTASWNASTKKLDITYESKQVAPKQVMAAVAKAGYDAGTVKASKSACSDKSASKASCDKKSSNGQSQACSKSKDGKQQECQKKKSEK